MNDQSANVTRLAPMAAASGKGLFEHWKSANRRHSRIAMIGNYAPRKCGIATFTTDLHEKLGEFHPDIECDVYALDDPELDLCYPDHVATFAYDRVEDFRRMAAAINESGADAVWLQHEFGIFGGTDGEMVVELVDRLAEPLIVTLHTVLEQPSERQRAIVEHLAARATRVVVMNRHSQNLLADDYGVANERIAVIEHGAPERPFGRKDEQKARLGLEDRKVLMTFGLLGPGKGLEFAIAALPSIIEKHPSVVYRIVGATHPNLLARDGETYREELQSLAATLGVGGHVQWDNRFLESDELLDQLEGCDIYLTPYLNLQQSTSGTLSYAVALGKAVVSTPYIHACELLSDGVGCMVPPRDSDAIGEAVCKLLDDPEKFAAIERRAYARGRQTVWPRFADASADLVATAVAEPTSLSGSDPRRPNPAAVFALSDATGMLQHALGPVADRRHGYCLDDNARALMLANRLDGGAGSEVNRAAQTYAAFLQDCWNPERSGFRNFMRFDRSWCEEIGSEDSNGRAIWALGDCINRARDRDLATWARHLYDQALPISDSIESPRALAFLALGALERLEREPEHGASRRAVERACGILAHLLERTRRPDWRWFEAVLAYDNPRPCQVLIAAGDRFARADWLSAGLETLEWIAPIQRSAQGHFRPIGSDSLGRGELPPMPFDQQPIEALAAIEAAAAAWRATGDKAWLDNAHAAFEWFLGANDRGTALADPRTGRCRDGLTPHGANENCGAESILAYHLSFYSMLALSRHCEDHGDESVQQEQRKGAPAVAYP